MSAKCDDYRPLNSAEQIFAGDGFAGPNTKLQVTDGSRIYTTDHLHVISFYYRIDKPIPEGRWAEYGLWR